MVPDISPCANCRVTLSLGKSEGSLSIHEGTAQETSVAGNSSDSKDNHLILVVIVVSAAFVCT